MIKSKDENVLLTKYLYYWLLDTPRDKPEHRRHWLRVFAEKEIPVPAIETQKKIVAILEEAEEAANKLHYFVPNAKKVATAITTQFSERAFETLCRDAEVFSLKELSYINTGKSNRVDEDPNGQYPFFVRSQTVLRSSTYLYDEEAVIIPGEGGIGKIFHFVQGKYQLHQRAYRITPKVSNIKAKYIYYYLLVHFEEYINKIKLVSTISSIRKGMIEDFKIPVPSLEIQEAIIKEFDSIYKNQSNHFNSLELIEKDQTVTYKTILRKFFAPSLDELILI